MKRLMVSVLVTWKARGWGKFMETFEKSAKWSKGVGMVMVSEKRE